MLQKLLKNRLVGTLRFGLLVLVMGCQDQPDTKKASEDEKPVVELPYPLSKLVGRWQTECDYLRYAKPVRTSIDFRSSFLRWTNHFYRDHNCVHTDEVERTDYFFEYIGDERILGNVSAHRFRLQPGLTSANTDKSVRDEIFQVSGNWLYISADGSGPDFGAPWDLDSNFGLLKLH